MNLKTHLGYVQFNKESDGSYEAFIFDVNGNILENYSAANLDTIVSLTEEKSSKYLKEDA